MLFLLFRLFSTTLYNTGQITIAMLVCIGNKGQYVHTFLTLYTSHVLITLKKKTRTRIEPVCKSKEIGTNAHNFHLQRFFYTTGES